MKTGVSQMTKISNKNIVLISGITGIEKSKYVGEIIAKIGQDKVDIHYVESKINEDLNKPSSLFKGPIWTIEDDEKRMEILNNKWNGIIKEIKKSKKPFHLIEFHCSWWRPYGFLYDNFRVIESLKEEKLFKKISCLIVLIDNITSIKWRLRAKFEKLKKEYKEKLAEELKKENKKKKTEEKAKGSITIANQAAEASKLGLRDIIIWRENEITISNLISDFLWPRINKKPIFIISRKHTPEMVGKLIMNPNQKKVYAAFPVRHLSYLKDRDLIQEWEEEANEIKGLKDKLIKKGCIVFDPYTIYEKEIESLLIDPNPERVAEEFEKFFLSNTKAPRLNKNLFFDDFFPIDPMPTAFSLSIWEIAQVVRDINAQIRERDRLMVKQSDFAIALRPEDSRGARTELYWSIKYNGKAGAIIMNNQNWEKVKNTPTTNGEIFHQEGLQKFLEEVKIVSFENKVRQFVMEKFTGKISSGELNKADLVKRITDSGFPFSEISRQERKQLMEECLNEILSKML
jgi:hypothetical protein